MHTQISVHTFNSPEDDHFDTREYSRLKFGSNNVAKKYGAAIAAKVFTHHTAELLAEECVVIPSPYNYVVNAATLVTKQFVNSLNALLVHHNGNHCEYSTIHRKISYIKDYGFLTAAERKTLIDQDDFFFNPEFYKNKILIFVDDVRITGTHEFKLVELLNRHNINNRCIFAYYATYTGCQADTEAKINFAAVHNHDDFVKIVTAPDHKMTVRPIKYILGKLSGAWCDRVLSEMQRHQIESLYYGCLGEGYYKIPEYQPNFHKIQSSFLANSKN